MTLSDDGTILDIKTLENPDTEAGVEYFNGILIPGMVNAHCHLELSHMRGAIEEGTGLVGFLKKVVTLRANVSEDDQKQIAERWDAKMWSDGVQAVGDIGNIALTYEIKAKSKIYYHTFVEYFDFFGGNSAEKYDTAENYAKQAEKIGITATTTPHAPYSVSEGLFRWANESGRLSIHFMETPAEMELFEHRGAFYDWFLGAGVTMDYLGHGSPAGRLVDTVRRDIPLLAVHNSFIREVDIRRLNEHFDNVTYVLCPRSNRYIERSKPPVEMIRDMGGRMAIGTDSLSSNSSLEMIEEMKLLQKEFNNVSLGEILGWATIGGAEALGVEEFIGSLEVGKRPGVVLIEGADLNGMRLTDISTSRRLV